jgi:hypothetical protein
MSRTTKNKPSCKEGGSGAKKPSPPKKDKGV